MKILWPKRRIIGNLTMDTTTTLWSQKTSEIHDLEKKGPFTKSIHRYSSYMNKTHIFWYSITIRNSITLQKAVTSTFEVLTIW